MHDDKKKKFLEAYDAYAEPIFRHCFFRVFSRQRAEELMQEAFMRTWEYMQDGKDVENMRAFLYRVANNLIVDESRKHKEESLDVLMEDSNAFEPADEGHKDIERQVLLKEVMQRMKDLPHDYQEILTMRYVDDLDPKDIAHILGTNANNISVKLNRAMHALQQKFDQ